jgi:ATP-dependent exoDNAse (exonuclease V) beta subunit
LGILSDLAMEINQLTAEQNTLLISDANLLLNRIIDNSDTPYVYEKIGNKLQHFMIDEFQDTSVLQWKNFLPLVRNSLAEDKFNMVVGDVKQSIYRWRNSDWNLLDEQIFKDFSPEQIRQEPLKTNWRSDRNIVEFNNNFFTQSAQILQQQLNSNIQEYLPFEKYPDVSELSTKIQHAYTDTEQKVSEKAGDGHVCIQFIPNEGKNWQEESLNRLPSLLENFQDHGYKASDIAILVREKKDAAIIIQSLMNYKNSPSAKEGYCYDVLGNEGLLIGKASSVRFIIGLLKLLVSPSDDIQLAILNIEYALNVSGKSVNEAVQDISAFDKNTEKKFSQIFNSEEENALQEIRHYSLFDRVEQIISLFEIGKWENQAPFVQAFQDLVYSFTAKGSSDISDFLSWWDETGCKKFVAMPADQEAIHIMTIHKAKGLDFPVVILPFCDWALEGNVHKTNVLWCETNVPPFNELPLLPISYAKYLKQSIFAQNYFEEQMHLYIDSLNLAYVAFTRPKYELVCLTPTPDEKKEEKKKNSDSESLKNISSLLWQFIQTQQSSNEENSFVRNDDEKQIFERGKATYAPQQEKISSIKFEKFVQYPSCNSAQKLQIRHQDTQYFIEEKDLSDSQLNYGIIMHEILRKITNKTDQDKVLQEFVLSGQIGESERKTVEEGLEKFWLLPQAAKWFNGEGRILNEATILSPEGRQHRPDKVIIKDNKAIVIDYKFGQKENKFYLSQVKEYMNLIAQMGYQTEGYVCYSELGKVIEVL